MNKNNLPKMQDRLRWLMKRRDRSMQSLSRAVGMSDGGVKNLMNRDTQIPRADNLAKIAAELDVRPDWILGTWTPVEDLALRTLADDDTVIIIEKTLIGRTDLLAGQADIEDWEPIWAAELQLMSIYEVLLLPSSESGARQSPPPAGNAAISGEAVQLNGPRDLPVYASAAAGDEGMTITFEPVDYVPRPPQLGSSKTAYSVYVVNDSMEPKYRQGTIIFVDTIKPPRRGDLVFVVMVDGQDNTHEALVKELVSSDSESLHLKQYNPKREVTIPQRRVHTVHRVAGNWEP